MDDIDPVDKEILKMLAKDSRQSYTELGKKLELSDVAVRKRIEKLLEKGVIRNFSININQSKLGKGLHSFLLLRTNPNHTDTIQKELVKLPQVKAIDSTLGSFDIILETYCQGVNELKKLAEEDIGSLPGLIEARTLIVINDEGRD